MTMPDDHLVVLFGATGDLAKRKLLPGLFRLAQAGLLPPRYRIVGTALEDLDDNAFRELARAAVGEFGGGSRDPDAWQRFARNLLYADARDRTALTAAAGTAELRARRRASAAALPLGAAGRIRRGGGDTRRSGARTALARRRREAVRYRSRVRARVERPPPQCVRRVADLSHRPLPRQGDGPEHPGAPVRERHLRDALEPEPHRARPDRRPRDALDRLAWLLLRGHGRLPGHARHPSAPGARLRGDGTADVVRGQGARRRDGARSSRR